MHTTDKAIKLLDSVLKSVYDNPDKFSLSLSDMNSEDPFVFIHIIYDDIIKGIIGKFNIEEIVSKIGDKDLVIYGLPESPDKDGYMYIEITNMLESTSDIEYLETLDSILSSIIHMDDSNYRFFDSKVQDDFEDWSFETLDSETKAIVYDYCLLKSETKNILNSYNIDDKLYAKIYDWLDFHADVDGFALSYEKEDLEEFLKNL